MTGKGGYFLVQEIIRIEGLECNHCVVRVGRAIASVQGVMEVDVNLEKREAVVDFEETRTNMGKIRTAIREAAYIRQVDVIRDRYFHIFLP